MPKRNVDNFMYKIMGDLLIGLTAGFLVLIVQDIKNKSYLLGAILLIVGTIFFYWEMWKRKLE